MARGKTAVLYLVSRDRPVLQTPHGGGGGGGKSDSGRCVLCDSCSRPIVTS